MKIKDTSKDKKYFTIIPNYIANHSSANDQALYFQMKKIVGDNEDICYASEKYFKDKLKIGSKALKKSIQYLLDHEWIENAGQREIQTKGGIQTSNVYLVKDIWKLNIDYYQDKGVSEREPPKHKGVSESNQRGVQKETKGVAFEQQRRTYNNNHNNNYSNSEATASQVNFVSEIIKLFEEVNPACKNYYGNTTQRKAVENLIDTYSLKKVKEVIAILPQSNQMAYVPTITTPYQLEQKWVQLESTLKKKKNEIKSKKPNVI